MEENEIKVLRRFIGWLMSSDSSPRVWDRVSPETRFAVRSAYFLLNDDPGRDAESFVTITLERMLQRVSRVNESLQAEYQGEVRGRVVWPATLKARYREDFDQTRFVCRQIRYEYDTPENQLLKFVVERIFESLRAIPDVIRRGFIYSPASASAEIQSPGRSADERLSRMESSLRNFHRHSRLRSVNLPTYITESHLRRAKISSTGDYAVAADLYQEYARCFLRDDWRRRLSRITRQVLPLPAELTSESEIWLQIGAELARERNE